MKRIISLLLVLVLIFTIIPCAFAEKKFDYKEVLGNRDGYSYDKFEKRWEYYRAYVEKYSDARVVIGIKAWGEDGGSNLDYTEMYVKVMDTNGKQLHEVESIDFLIGDDMYSYESMWQGDNCSSVVLGEQGLLFIKAMAECEPEDVTIRIGLDSGSLTIDPKNSELKDTLRKFCRVYVKNNIWDYCVNTDFCEMMEMIYPLSINGELVSEMDEA